MLLLALRREIKKREDPKKAKLLQRFFKTGKGQYGEGDVFLGITVPETRMIAKKYKDLTLQEIEELLHSKNHEERLCALLILVHNFEKHPEKREEIFNFYISNTKNINNWDLVDLSAPSIFGRYILMTGKANPMNESKIFSFANSENLWERRIAILGTFYFIKNNGFEESLEVAAILMNDKHDLIHKAVGWMLREIGKRNLKVEEDFLKKHYKKMPRTMLRYAIERFEEKKRLTYLYGKI